MPITGTKTKILDEKTKIGENTVMSIIRSPFSEGHMR